MTRGDHALRLARAYLLRVAEPPAVALAAFVAEQGAEVAARLVSEGRAPSPVVAETSARRHLRQARSDVDAAAVVGARLVVPEDDEWPRWPLQALALASARGLRCAVEPLALWVRGRDRLADLFDRAVAVVGARDATGYGEHVAAELGHGLAQHGVTVVSGAAYGIDGAAHGGALHAEGATVAVLACGVDVPYPAGHTRLLERIAQHGAVLSEYPPGTPPARHRFLVRNRLIAALAEGTVVVEAGRRSGAKNTAAAAEALGRVVMAVPGPVTSAKSVGCHELLRSNVAVAVTTAAEIVESAGRIGDLAESAPRPERVTDGLDPQALRVYESLGQRAGRGAEWISVDSGIDLPQVRALLPALELAGLAQRCEAGWRRARSPTSGGANRRGDA
jgi:DNA processing protein